VPRWRQRWPSRAALPTTSRSSGQPPTYAKLRHPSARAYMVLLRSPPPLNSQAADRVVLLQHGCEGCCLRAHLRRLGRSCGARSARSHGGKAERCQSNQARAGTSTVASSRSLASFPAVPTFVTSNGHQCALRRSRARAISKGTWHACMPPFNRSVVQPTACFRCMRSCTPVESIALRPSDCDWTFPFANLNWCTAAVTGEYHVLRVDREDQRRC
jgi:hypothetical protein